MIAQIKNDDRKKAIESNKSVEYPRLIISGIL